MAIYDDSSARNRPYAGTWKMDNQTVVRHTPDCIVLINGHTEFASCATCNNKVDFNRYITQVSCDPTTEPISTASVSLTIPTNDNSIFTHDGNYVLKPGLEVLILMRGYFPVAGYAAKGQESSTDADENIPVYPYYQVFRGVVTEATHEYSGGFYTCSLACSNILHFWQYLQINTNGSVFGTSPKKDGGGIDLTGHKMNGMSPYSIIYTLMRVGFGSAFGVNWTIAQKANIAAVADGTGQSLYKHAALWWEKRWAEASTRLRMYGADGSLFNAFEQAFIGMFDVKGNAAKGAKFIKSFGIELPRNFDPKAKAEFQEAARTVGYRSSQFDQAVTDKQGTRQNVLKMQAFVLDLGRMGQPNMFDAEYMSKMEIANTVKDLTGFEFYQDVDGDIVFKPPYYNLDTSNDEVYCIEDKELISISEGHSEPESTYVKGSGGLFQNFTGILDGEFGTRQGKFIDWRLVAEFGWKEANFESQYMSSSGQLFVSAMMRLDLNNVEMKSASITIPLRPELRPGYPVYVECQDAFFYIKSMSHSFSVGGACQTTINGVAKRAKFMPPGMPDRSDGDGSQPIPTLDNVRLDSPGEYPPMPLYAYPEDLEGASSGAASGPPRIIGYPNCVMALDPDKLNPLTFPGGVQLGSGQAFLDFALTLGVLRRDPTNSEQYFLSVSGEPEQDKIVTYTEVVNGFADGGVADLISDAISSSDLQRELDDGSFATEQLGDARVSQNFGAALIGVMQRTLNDIEDSDLLGNWLSLQTATKNLYGHQSIQGQYRYFSSSAPDPEDQAPSEITIDEERGEVVKDDTSGTIEDPQDITLLKQNGSRIEISSGTPTRAFRVYGTQAGEGEEDEEIYTDVSTNDIRFVTFQRIVTRRRVPLSAASSTPSTAWQIDASALKTVMKDDILAFAGQKSEEDPCSDRFGDSTEGEAAKSGGYRNFLNLIEAWATTAQVNTDSRFSAKLTKLKTFSNALRSRQRTRLAADSSLKASDVWKQADPKAILNLSTQAASSLKSLLQIGLNRAAKVARDAQRANGGEPDTAVLNRLNKAKADFFGGLDNVVADPSTRVPVIITDQFVESSDHSLVLPVSDNEGYEVYGSLSYGRGLNITSYKSLLDLEGTPTDTNSMASIEKFIAGLIAAGGKAGAGVTKALNALSVEERANMAAGLNVSSEGNALEEAVATLIDNADSEQVFIRNTPVSSRTRGQSYTSDMSINELASMTAEDGGVCLCNGVEEAYWLAAFAGEFVDTYGDDAVTEWLKQQAVEEGQDYVLTKEALAGGHMDSRSSNKLLETWNEFTGGYENLIDDVRGGLDRVKDEVQRLEDLEIPDWDGSGNINTIQILDEDGFLPGVPDSLQFGERSEDGEDEDENTETGGRSEGETPMTGTGKGNPFNEPYTQGPPNDPVDPGGGGSVGTIAEDDEGGP